MICAWNELLAIIPERLKYDVISLGKDKLLELRLRLGRQAELILMDNVCWIGKQITSDELEQCINNASRFSPWTAGTIGKGYFTAPGGHRIGICGECVIKEGNMTGIRNITSLCIRVARDFPGIGNSAGDIRDSTIILGAPGWGKTTLLRDVARSVASRCCVSVVDERREIFPEHFPAGKRMDILSGTPKTDGIEIVLRCMGPEYIAVDEITAQEDTTALLHVHGCGVKLLATAHAGSLDEFFSRLAYRQLLEHSVFKRALVLHPDKTYTSERITG